MIFIKNRSSVSDDVPAVTFGGDGTTTPAGDGHTGRPGGDGTTTTSTPEDQQRMLIDQVHSIN